MSELAIGNAAPDFSMETDHAGTVSLSSFKGKNLVLYFYPKDDTPGCTKQAISFSEHESDFAAANTVILGVSRDPVKKHEKFRAKHDLTIQLASDEEGATTEAYGVWVEKNMYGKKYMGIERATYLIDRNGTVQEIWRKVRVAGHIEKVLAAVESLNTV